MCKPSEVILDITTAVLAEPILLVDLEFLVDEKPLGLRHDVEREVGDWGTRLGATLVTPWFYTSVWQVELYIASCPTCASEPPVGRQSTEVTHLGYGLADKGTEMHHVVIIVLISCTTLA